MNYSLYTVHEAENKSATALIRPCLDDTRYDVFEVNPTFNFPLFIPVPLYYWNRTIAFTVI
jgi:hypothetical protein